MALLPTPTLPAIITDPPTAQFTPGPGCIDPDDNWVVITSCYAYPLDLAYTALPSPDWLTCQLTQFGPAWVVDSTSPCYQPISTVVDDQPTYYTGCPSGYDAVSSDQYTLTSGAGSAVDYQTMCCPTMYNFRSNYPDNGVTITSERDGVAWAGFYPVPGCTARFIEELSGKQIPVQTAYNTYGWEKRKRQVAEVPWDYEGGTMYAEQLYVSSTVFQGTHTCYGYCFDWYDYYFSGSPAPTTVTEVNILTTPPAEPPITTDAPPSPTEGETVPPVEDTSTPEVTEEPSTSPVEIPPATTIATPTEEATPSITSTVNSESPSIPPSTSTTTSESGGSTPPSSSSLLSPSPTSGSRKVASSVATLTCLFLSGLLTTLMLL